MSAETIRWIPAAPGSLPDTARTVLLWTPPTVQTFGKPGVFMGWLQADKLRFCDARVEADARHPRPVAWAEMPAGPDASGPAPAPGLLRWRDPEAEPMPEGVHVLIIEADGSHRIAALDQSGYLFADNGDNLDAAGVVWWAPLPAAPGAPIASAEGSS